MIFIIWQILKVFPHKTIILMLLATFFINAFTVCLYSTSAIATIYCYEKTAVPVMGQAARADGAPGPTELRWIRPENCPPEVISILIPR